MEFAISLGIGGWILVIVGAVVFGLVAQFVGEAKTGWEWLADAVAVGFGAIVASEFVISWQAIEPVWDGLAIVPALIGGIVLGLVVEVVTRLATGGTYTTHHPPMSA
jgi:uncharacterized membrane protein YeaQ/YmgE (transglycosylase-associated protein family)